MVNRSARLLFFLRPLLWPLSLIYALITSVRNALFDTGLLKSTRPPVFSVGVGNLAVGGTGKTPMISFLIQKLNFDQIAVLSRGYRRKTKGFIEVTASETPSTVGDETFMLFQRHQKEARFFVCEDRVKGVKKILESRPETNLILFDDVFQHRRVKPCFQLLLSKYSNPFFEDYQMPFGTLREARKGFKRAQAVVFTKCPQVLEKEKYLTAIADEVPAYFSRVSVAVPRNVFGETLETGEKVNIISALADNLTFVDQVKSHFDVLELKPFRDHHSFVRSDLSFTDPNLPVICSEKDWVKIKELLSDAEQLNYYVQKIEVVVEEEAGLLRKINQAHKRFKLEKGSVING